MKAYSLNNLKLKIIKNISLGINRPIQFIIFLEVKEGVLIIFNELKDIDENINIINVIRI